MKAVIVKKVSERTKRLILSKFPRDWKVVMVTPGELNKELEDVEAIIPEHHIIDGPLLDRAKNLKLVQTGAGYDNVMVDECTKRGVYVANAAGINAPAVAEHVFAFILCWYKNMISLDGLMKRGEYGVEYINLSHDPRIGGNKFIQRIIGAASAIVAGTCWLAKKAAPRKFIRAARARKYPGTVTPLGDIGKTSKWSG